MNFLAKLSKLIIRFMPFIILIVAVIAFFVPQSFLWASNRLPLFVGIVMFGMGMTIRFNDFKIVFSRPKDVLIGTLLQFTIMPILAFVLVKLFQLPPELALGVILVGACPGGTSSNVMTYVAKGDVALSVGITLVSTLLAPIVTPFLTWILANSWFEISFGQMLFSIVQVVIIPILMGLYFQHALGRYATKIDDLILPIVSVLALIFIAGGAVAANVGKLMTAGILVGAVVILHNLLGYAIGYFAAKKLGFNLAKQKALAIEVGMQNSSLSTSLAITNFTLETVLPSAIFNVWHNISGPILAHILSHKEEKLPKL
ncbi:MAG: bile acid:sodium symporter family protein [Clostridia bacterium]|nr:bile acid:sodium symporter family protein [Clostridia bacterium]